MLNRDVLFYSWCGPCLLDDVLGALDLGWKWVEVILRVEIEIDSVVSGCFGAVGAGWAHVHLGNAEIMVMLGRE